MRNVSRKPKPAALQRNARRWQREYLDALASGDAKMKAKRRKRYNHQDVRRSLDAMYENLCCYCEGQVGPVRADQIEHRRPITKFPKKAFEWNNLHLSCGGCNGAKSNKWDAAHPILDAVKDVPIKDHLDHECSITGVRRAEVTPRGRITVEHADLNREKLREARTLLMMEVVGVIQEIRRRLDDDPNDPLAHNRLKALEERYAGPYGSMIRWAVSTLL